MSFINNCISLTWCSSQQIRR